MPRKGPKTLPSLPLSVFTPPNTGTSDQFPLSGGPSNVHPESVVDAHVIAAGGDLSQWKKESGQSLGRRIGGVVLSLPGQGPADVEHTLAELESSNETAIIAVIVPFSLNAETPAAIPKSKYPISLSAAYTGTVSETSLKWALKHGHTLELVVQGDVMGNDSQWDAFEDMLTTAIRVSPKSTPIVLSNLLPPPANLELPMVKLMSHPSYRAYESHIAALSLFPNLYVKFLPPDWNATTPPATEASSADNDNKEKKEWKRRIKMYLGPVLEAFGFQRIIFGSSPSSAASSTSHAGDWYEIARECVAELNVEREAVNGVFSENAREVYCLSK